MLSMLLYVIIIENSYNNNNNNVQDKVSLTKGLAVQWLNVPKKKKRNRKKGRCGSRERHKKQNKAPHVSHI